MNQRAETNRRCDSHIPQLMQTRETAAFRVAGKEEERPLSRGVRIILQFEVNKNLKGFTVPSQLVVNPKDALSVVLLLQKA